ncbi:hypothetical protein VKT23_014004 [Stygiomarasmius scandens]|uniref:Uncharacterized protein n=1 Tax=Marasmiellus scandens TaxID=2682957 RepID=A0ABR1J5C1_9AGAR
MPSQYGTQRPRRSRSRSPQRRSRRDRSRSHSRSSSSRHSSHPSSNRNRSSSRSSSPPSSGSSRHRRSRDRSSSRPDSRNQERPSERPIISNQEKARQAQHRNLVRRLLGRGGLKGLENADLLSRYTVQAGWVLRGFHLFANVNNIFEHGLRSQGFDIAIANVQLDDNDNEQDDDGVLDDDSLPVDAEYVELYERLLDTVPDLRDTMERFKKDPTGLALFIKKIGTTARSARGTDVSNLKDAVLMYIPQDPLTDTLHPPLPAHAPKSERGFNHEAIAPLLVPWHQYEEYSADPQAFVTQALNKQKPIVTHETSPFFMYDKELYNADDSELGFGRGYLFIRVLRHFLRGPSSVYEDPDASKRKSGRSLAKTYRVKALTPQILAYVACLTRFSLSSKSTWKATDGLFSLRVFYRKVVMMFSDSEDEWVKETMDFLNSEVLGQVDEDVEPEYLDDPNAEEDEETKTIRARREARRLAREKAAEDAARKAAEEEAATQQTSTSTSTASQSEEGNLGSGAMDTST